VAEVASVMSVGYDAALSEAVVPPAHVVWLQRAQSRARAASAREAAVRSR